MTGQSKLISYCSCREFQHPWTNKCVNASAGIILAATPYCLKMYAMVYMVSMLMRQRPPKRQDLYNMLWGIIQSSAFLVTNAYTFVLYNCLIRKLLGCYYLSTIAFWPSLLASYSAILVERPQRRTLLALYVSNVATETFWNILKSRGLVVSIRNGQAIIYGLSITILLYLYRLGLHKTICRDSIFDILRLLMGKQEEGPLKCDNTKQDQESDNNNMSFNEPSTSTIGASHHKHQHEHHHHHHTHHCQHFNRYQQVYKKLCDVVKGRHKCCPHEVSCFYYILSGGLKPLLGGIGLQVALKVLLNFKHIIKFKGNYYRNIFNRKTMHIGLFLGSFSFIYKAISCSLRHIFGRDDAKFSIPAGLLSSIGFLFYPNTTIALYVMWKMFQIVYTLGMKQRKLPRVPHFTIILYSVCTALLFHAGILEPRNIRQSYYKFLQAISGERLSKFNMRPFDEAFGFSTSLATNEVKQRLRIIDKSPLPKCSLADW